MLSRWDTWDLSRARSERYNVRSECIDRRYEVQILCNAALKLNVWSFSRSAGVRGMHKLWIHRQTAGVELRKRSYATTENWCVLTYKYDLPNSRFRTNWPGEVGIMHATAGLDTVRMRCESGKEEPSSSVMSSNGCAAAKTSTPSGQRKST
jgi:hypothetical protein